jgi:[acyl-carrier-protein] S-malonyltransferase
MGRGFAETSGEVRAMYDEADRLLNAPLSRIAFEGPADDLVKTVNTQPALLLHSVAAITLLAAHDIVPSAAAGHSLGEYSALVAAGALTWQDALLLVRRRGDLMYQAGLDWPGAMAAILGLGGDDVQTICAEVVSDGGGVVQPANLNSPGQVVISGEIHAVERAMTRAKERGAKRVIRLDVSGAFHSPLMGTAAAGLADAIRATSIADARVPVYVNVSARPVRTARDIAEALTAQLLGTVRWEESMRALVHDGFTLFLEVGSGKVLKGLMRSIAPEVEVLSVEDPESLTKAVEKVHALSA